MAKNNLTTGVYRTREALEDHAIAMRKEGITKAEIARITGVSFRTVSRIVDSIVSPKDKAAERAAKRRARRTAILIYADRGTPRKEIACILSTSLSTVTRTINYDKDINDEIQRRFQETREKRQQEEVVCGTVSAQLPPLDLKDECPPDAPNRVMGRLACIVGALFVLCILILIGNALQ